MITIHFDRIGRTHDRAEQILADNGDKARYERRGENRFAVAPVYKCEVLP